MRERDRETTIGSESETVDWSGVWSSNKCPVSPAHSCKLAPILMTVDVERDIQKKHT